jgi:hypothetical protein
MVLDETARQDLFRRLDRRSAYREPNVTANLGAFADMISTGTAASR